MSSNLVSGEIHSVVLFNRLVRKETSFTTGGRFYRFTLDPGLRTEYATYWSTDEEKLYKNVVKKIKGHSKGV
jgi:hypothetical protein